MSLITMKPSRPVRHAPRAADLLLAGSALAALVSALPAHAQTAEEATGEDGIVSIVVTAQKREENIQTVPISITALTSDTLQERQIRSISEIASYVPNLQYAGGASAMTDSTNFFIRGIGQDDFITTFEPGVGLYVDGVYLARVTGAALNMGEVERIEVLRGPQGTLFGRNTIGGAINVVTADPGADFHGRGSVTAGNLGTVDGNFDVSVPIVGDQVAASLSFMSHNTTGYGRNVWEGAEGNRNLGRAENVAMRGKLLIRPTDSLKLVASFDYTRNRGTVVPLGLIDFQSSTVSDNFNESQPVAIGPEFIGSGPYDVQLDGNTRTATNVKGGSLTATWEGDVVGIKSITSYREQDVLTGGDYDGTPTPYLQQTVNIDQWQVSQEFQVYGGAPGDALQWLVGAYYFEEKGRFFSEIDLQATPITIDTGSRTKSYAVFGQGTYAITDKLSLTVGGRWTRDRKNLDVHTIFGGAEVVPLSHRKASFSNFSPMAKLQYQANSDLMVYAGVSRGFRSGGFNGRPFSANDLVSFDPETVTSYETGLKSQWLDDRLQLNLAFYYADYQDLQMGSTSSDDEGNFVDLVGNAASAEIYGLELEIKAIPVDHLQIYGSLGITENELKEKPHFSFGATRLPDASKLNFTVGADYKVGLGSWGNATFAADYSYRSGFYPQFGQTAESFIDGYGLLGARVGFAPAGKAWTLTFYGKNLTDEEYLIYGQTAGTGDATTGFYGKPREYGATFSFVF